MPIAPRLRALVTEISALEERSDNQATMLDDVLDMHNDLTEWAVNTEHSVAAQEVMAILEKYARPKESHLRSVV